MAGKTPGQILREYREKKELTQREVADAIGVGGQQNVQKWETGAGRVPPRHYPALVRLLDLPIDELLDATPEPGLTDARRACAAEGLLDRTYYERFRESARDAVREIPMAATLIPIVGFVAGDPDSDIAWEPAEHVKTTHFAGCSALEVQGDSMEPVAMQGQLVIFDERAEVRDGDLAIVRLKSGKSLFKRVFWDAKKPGQLKCQSVKTTYPPLDIDEDELEDVWRVVGVKFA